MGSMRSAETTSATEPGKLLRRLIWHRMFDDLAMEFCELRRTQRGHFITGKIIAAVESRPALVSYCLTCVEDLTRCIALQLNCTVENETRLLALEVDQDGRWLTDGRPSPDLNGCTDPDIEWSPSTNLFPIRRLPAAEGSLVKVRAAWIRLPSLEVEPTQQNYARIGSRQIRYRNDLSGFEAGIEVDEVGLPVHYEGIWSRTADWRSP
jgi:hypothetical protein